MKKISIANELIYLAGIALLAFAVNLMSIANLGLSAIVSPAYVLSLKVDSLSYGQAEYIIASILFVLFCLIMKKFRLAYLSSFITGILYATMADFFKNVFPLFSASLDKLSIRILYFIIGILLSALAIAFFYKTYFYPQIYDFFVKEIAKKFQISIQKFKTGFDCSFLLLAMTLSFIFFHQLKGIGIGTFIMAICNGTFIQFFTQILDHYFNFVPIFNPLANYLENGGNNNGI